MAPYAKKNPANFALAPTANYCIALKNPANDAITPKYRPDYAIEPKNFDYAITYTFWKIC